MKNNIGLSTNTGFPDPRISTKILLLSNCPKCNLFLKFLALQSKPAHGNGRQIGLIVGFKL